ncbi:MAG: HdeD family acid-resistance protein [Anaerolineae bacterium]|jgi:uncharacterized membrane protein HdeD (DUF308 family)
MTADTWEFETEQSPWWLILMAGALNLIVGILLLANPGKTAIALAWVLGFYWFVQGMLILVAMFLDHSAWGWKLFMGALGILAGLVVMRHPIASALVVPSILVLLLGIQGLVMGGISLVLAFRGGGWGAGILGALSLLFGIILILNYANLTTVLTFIWIVAILAIVGGIFQIVVAFQQR